MSRATAAKLDNSPGASAGHNPTDLSGRTTTSPFNGGQQQDDSCAARDVLDTAVAPVPVLHPHPQHPSPPGWEVNFSSEDLAGPLRGLSSPGDGLHCPGDGLLVGTNASPNADSPASSSRDTGRVQQLKDLLSPSSVVKYMKQRGSNLRSRKSHTGSTYTAHNSLPTQAGANASEEEEDKYVIRFEDKFREFCKMFQIAGPLLIQYSVSHLAGMTGTAYVGHLEDPVLLSAMVLGGSLSMATGYHVVSGLASASETLSGQAYGARNFRALVATLQRSFLICATACIPISLMWINMDWALMQLGQPADLAKHACRYMQLSIPALYLHVLHECLDKFLLAQNQVKPGVVITTITTALTPAYCYACIHWMGMGLDGAAYSYCATQATTTFLTLGYVLWREKQLEGTPEHASLMPTMEAFQKWKQYLMLAAPATVMYCMEGWATEVLIFLSGLLKNAEVAVGVTGLCLQVSTLVWMAAASIASATSTRVANSLGAGNARSSKIVAQTALAMVVVSQLLVGLLAFSFRGPMMHIMTNNDDVINMTLQVMPILTVCFLGDGMNAVLGAVLRGAGRQWVGAYLNLFSWWVVGVPLAYFLAIVEGLNVNGLWAGFATAGLLQSFVQWYVIRNLDWGEEVKRARKMMGDLKDMTDPSPPHSPKGGKGEGMSPFATGCMERGESGMLSEPVSVHANASSGYLQHTGLGGGGLGGGMSGSLGSVGSLTALAPAMSAGSGAVVTTDAIAAAVHASGSHALGPAGAGALTAGAVSRPATGLVGMAGQRQGQKRYVPGATPSSAGEKLHDSLHVHVVRHPHTIDGISR